MTNNLTLPMLSKVAAENVNKKLEAIGIPTVDRVVIAISNKDFKTQSGIIIPGGNKEDVPKRGTIVQVGKISNEYFYFNDLLKVGSIITYGNYAGKKIEPSEVELEEYDLMVLSLTEICYIEF